MIKEKGIPMFKGFNNMEELRDFVLTFKGSEGSLAMIVMMQTLQTINNIEDRELKERLSQLKTDTKKTMEKIHGNN